MPTRSSLFARREACLSSLLHSTARPPTLASQLNRRRSRTGALSHCSLRSLRCSLVAAVFVGSGETHSVTNVNPSPVGFYRLLPQIGGTNIASRLIRRCSRDEKCVRISWLAPLAAELQPLIAFETEIERDHDQQHHAEDDEVAVFPVELGHVVEVHAVDSRDQGWHHHDCHPA